MQLGGITVNEILSTALELVALWQDRNYVYCIVICVFVLFMIFICSCHVARACYFVDVDSGSSSILSFNWHTGYTHTRNFIFRKLRR